MRRISSLEYLVEQDRVEREKFDAQLDQRDKEDSRREMKQAQQRDREGNSNDEPRPALSKGFQLLLFVLVIGILYFLHALSTSSYQQIHVFTEQENKFAQEGEILKKEIYGQMKELFASFSSVVQLVRDNEAMHQDIQKAELIKNRLRWGEGPLKVTMNTSFGVVLLETAPFDQMPVALGHWLGLVDVGCHFIRNAQHVLQANCNFRNPRHTAAPKILFQEFSPTYPHVQYTLGLAGRPASVDFYVNLKDNTRAHGPGGQAGSLEADPCFAKVLKEVDDVGTEVVDAIVNSIKDQPHWLTAETAVLIHDIYINRN